MTTDSRQGALFPSPGPRRRRAAALRSHHVRSHEPAAEALAGEARALRQEERVLAWFLAHGPGERWTPSQVWQALEPELHWPITSARRALTNLTRAGDLAHHPADRRPSRFGGRESTWSLLPPEGARSMKEP